MATYFNPNALDPINAENFAYGAYATKEYVDAAKAATRVKTVMIAALSSVFLNLAGAVIVSKKGGNLPYVTLTKRVLLGSGAISAIAALILFKNYRTEKERMEGPLETVSTIYEGLATIIHDEYRDQLGHTFNHKVRLSREINEQRTYLLARPEGMEFEVGCQPISFADLPPRVREIFEESFERVVRPTKSAALPYVSNRWLTAFDAIPPGPHTTTLGYKALQREVKPVDKSAAQARFITSGNLKFYVRMYWAPI